MVLHHPTPVTQLSLEDYGDVTNMEEVGQDQVSMVEFRANNPDRIGLWTFLTGGTAVAIVSDSAAILLHVTRALNPGANHEDKLLTELIDLYKDNSDLFRSDRVEIYLAIERSKALKTVLVLTAQINSALDMNPWFPSVQEYDQPGQMLEIRDPRYTLQFGGEL